MLYIIYVLIIAIKPVYGSEYIDKYMIDAQKVGEGRLSYLFWDVYDATLYAPEGMWQKKHPFALELYYLRAIKGKKIADTSIEQIRNQGFSDEVKLADWHAQMHKIFPDVDEGTRLTGIYTKKGNTIFYQNGRQIGRIKDPTFSTAFFDIWLDQKTSAPNLRSKLLGTL
ncbi:MAG: chalcone isomerase family protein [Pseudomonadota bacterium]